MVWSFWLSGFRQFSLVPPEEHRASSLSKTHTMMVLSKAQEGQIWTGQKLQYVNSPLDTNIHKRTKQNKDLRSKDHSKWTGKEQRLSLQVLEA